MSKGFWMMQDDLVFIWIFLRMIIMLAPLVSLCIISIVIIIGSSTSRCS